MKSEEGESKIKVENSVGFSDEPNSSDMKDDSVDLEGKIKKEEIDKEKSKNPSVVVNHFKDNYTKCLHENIRLHQIITSLQESQHSMSLKVAFFSFLVSNYSSLTGRVLNVECSLHCSLKNYKIH